MKRLISIALVVFALAAVPAAFADGGTDLSTAPAPSATTAPAAPQEFGKRLEARLVKLDARLQRRIARLETACTATSAEKRCKNADQRIANLKQFDGRIQALLQKVRELFG